MESYHSMMITLSILKELLPLMNSHILSIAKDIIQVSLCFKGREIVHRDKGLELFKKILESLGEVAKIDAEPKMEGKQIIMILSPNVPS